MPSAASPACACARRFPIRSSTAPTRSSTSTSPSRSCSSRLRQGKVYKPEKVEQALTNFFRETNLSTLRELALRAVADEIGEKAASRRQREGLEPALIPERVMVCMSSSADAPRVLRAGARIAGRLGARWYAVYVETPREAPGHIKPQDRDALQRNIALAEELGATVVRVKADRPGRRPDRVRQARRHHARDLRPDARGRAGRSC